MRYCSQCGAAVDSKVKFCPECGAQIMKRGKRPASATARAPEAMPSRIRTVSHRAKRPSEAPSGGEVMEDCGDGAIYLEPTEAIPAGEAQRAATKTGRIKQKIPVKILVVGIVVVALVALGAFYLLTNGGGGFQGVPVYPGATESTYEGQTIEQLLEEVAQSLPAGWSAKMYQTTADAATVLNWYRGNMSGWTNVYDEVFQISSDSLIGYLAFTKDSDAVFNITADAGESHYFILMKGPAEDIESLISGNL